MVAVACGGGGKPKAVSKTTTTVAIDFCTVAREYVTKTQVALTQDLQDARSNPAAFQTRVRDDFTAADKQNQDLAKSAPSSVKADMDYLASAFHDFTQALETAGWDPMKVTPEAFQKLQDPQYYEASRRVNAYAQQACGVATPTTLTPTTLESLIPSTTRRASTTSTTRKVTTTTAAPVTTTTLAPVTTTTLPPTTTTVAPATTSTTVPCTPADPDYPDCGDF